jgi:hypothetical protein
VGVVHVSLQFLGWLAFTAIAAAFLWFGLDEGRFNGVAARCIDRNFQAIERMHLGWIYGRTRQVFARRVRIGWVVGGGVFLSLAALIALEALLDAVV